MNQKHKLDDLTARKMTEFVMQFDEETQDLWMRLFELETKQASNEGETKEVEILLSKLQLAIAEQPGGSTATLVAEQQAYQEALEAKTTSCAE